MRKRIILLIEATHLRVFGHAMSPMMKDFLSHLSWSFMGILCSSAIFFAGLVLIGRFLGPEEYGKYNLVLAISNIVAVFMLFGFDTTAIKFISDNKEEEKNAYLSNSFLALGVSSIVIGLLSASFYVQIARILNAEGALVLIAILMAAFSAFKTMFDSFTRAFHRFRYQAILKVIESVVFGLLVVGSLTLFGRNEYIYFIVPSIISLVIAVMFLGWPFFGRISRWSREAFDRSKKYLRLTLGVSLVGIILGTFDRLFIAKYLGVRELGIYSAYLMSSTVVVGQLTTALGNVFFPMMNGVEDKRQILDKVDRFMLWAFIPIIFSVSALSFVILTLFGSQYDINWLYIAAVSILSFLQILTTFYGGITSSSIIFLKFTSRIYFLKPIFIFSLYLAAYIFKDFGLLSIFLILFCSYLYDILNTRFAFKLLTR